MKLNINTLVRKMDGPARAIIEVEVTDLKPNEKFDQSMVNSIALGIYEQQLIATVYPCYTDIF